MNDASHASVALAESVVQQLAEKQKRLVLAESCTSGWMAATLGTIAGVSNSFCGSSVTYRDATKQAWLGIDPPMLERESAVSEAVTDSMATSVLQRTEEADLSLAITGHLGPDAPADLDGCVFVAIASRRCPGGPCLERKVTLRLSTTSRQERQREACTLAWQTLLQWLHDDQPDAR